MNPAILDVKAELEAAGLEVKPSGERSLWIAATTKDAGGGLMLSNDTSALIQQENRWVAKAVPSEGLELDGADGDFQLTEVLAAARQMVGSLEPETVRAAISAIAELPRINTMELDRLSDEAEGLLFHLRPRKPYVEGYTLAGWFRRVLGAEKSSPVEPEELLRQLGVLVRAIEIPDDLLDALACWGARHGPAVVLNKAGRHAQTPPGRRSTLAHELCH